MAINQYPELIFNINNFIISNKLFCWCMYSEVHIYLDTDTIFIILKPEQN